uniref:Eukaryotic translation initiation factor 5A n=1 Tax=Hemiselmis andersenii TaxID=464988 RepID=A0A6U2H4F6_HEMAN|eukprot:CAMPEP_0114108048 /NCGR_PEP_ID=MMETSP0043_2-20121206/6_1 /TAXON_ID=464988 /ORGANISM="Hemiselmis andersenii, Strain CCMP644" /LENGTH=156 /DNA_ID=CAMNT_0001199775 /DNA_START=43 /DNA_END=513 /DNA_ORIENTATION=+
MSDDDDYDAADSGAADCTPIEAGSVKMGKFLMIKGRPCKVVDVSKAKVGKHGAAKCHFVGVDIFTQKKLEAICPASAQLAEPIVDRTEYQLMDISDDDYVTMMDKDNNMREDLKMPEDDALCKKIREALDGGEDVLLTVLKAVGSEMIIDTKQGAK